MWEDLRCVRHRWVKKEIDSELEWFYSERQCILRRKVVENDNGERQDAKPKGALV